MIANYTAGGWEIISQRAHGLLAAQIAAQWKHTVRTERWTETLLAIAEHDDAQVELERDDLLTPQGGPVDFKMRKFELQHGKQTIDFALSKSRYIALLCSMHLDFVYGTGCAANAQAEQFLRQQRLVQQAWREELNLTMAVAERDYRLMEWCDALSLLLCQHETQPEARTVEISQGPDKKHYQLAQTGNDTLTVIPWPFQKDSFKLYFETRLIPKLSFKNAGEFKSEFLKADVKIKSWLFKKQVH